MWEIATVAVAPSAVTWTFLLFLLKKVWDVDKRVTRLDTILQLHGKEILQEELNG